MLEVALPRDTTCHTSYTRKLVVVSDLKMEEVRSTVVVVDSSTAVLEDSKVVVVDVVDTDGIVKVVVRSTFDDENVVVEVEPDEDDALEEEVEEGILRCLPFVVFESSVEIRFEEEDVSSAVDDDDTHTLHSSHHTEDSFFLLSTIFSLELI